MPASPFKSLPNLQDLQHIDRSLLLEFLARFQDSPAAPHRHLLNQNLSSTTILDGLIDLLAYPKRLSAPMREALAAIDHLADPQHHAELSFALSNGPVFADAPGTPPFQQALRLWLAKPYELPAPPINDPPPTINSSGKPAPNSLPITSSIPNSSARTDAGSSCVVPSLRTPHSEL